MKIIGSLFLGALICSCSTADQHNFCGKGSEYTNQLEELTGKKAVVWGSDFSWCAEGETAPRFQHCGHLNSWISPWKRPAIN